MLAPERGGEAARTLIAAGRGDLADGLAGADQQVGGAAHPQHRQIAVRSPPGRVAERADEVKLAHRRHRGQSVQIEVVAEVGVHVVDDSPGVERGDRLGPGDRDRAVHQMRDQALASVSAYSAGAPPRNA